MRYLVLHSALVFLLCLGTGEARGQQMPAWAAPAERMEPTRPDARRPAADIPPPPPPVPVDGGLLWLALAGAGYATRRLLRSDEV